MSEFVEGLSFGCGFDGVVKSGSCFTDDMTASMICAVYVDRGSAAWLGLVRRDG